MILNWSASPDLLAIGPLVIRWYGFLFALGFYVGYRIHRVMFAKEGLGQAALDRFFLHVFLGTLIGARLGHCLFYEPEIYLSEPWRILFIWQGGLASHGGALGVIAGCWLYAKKTRHGHPTTTLALLDRLAITAPLAGAMIRLGNFFNSEIIGKPTGGDYGVVFTAVDAIPRHPAQLYESAAYFLLFLLMLQLWKKGVLNTRGRLTGLYFLVTFSVRFGLEFVKENQVPFEDSLPLNLGQLLSLPMIVLGAILALRPSKK